MSKDQGRCSGGQKASLRRAQVSGLGDDRAGRETREPLAGMAGPGAPQADPPQWVAVSGGPGVLGHPTLPRLALARHTGIPPEPESLAAALRSCPTSSCHPSRARLGKATLTGQEHGVTLGVWGQSGLGWTGLGLVDLTVASGITSLLCTCMSVSVG